MSKSPPTWPENRMPNGTEFWSWLNTHKMSDRVQILDEFIGKLQAAAEAFQNPLALAIHELTKIQTEADNYTSEQLKFKIHLRIEELRQGKV